MNLIFGLIMILIIILIWFKLYYGYYLIEYFSGDQEIDYYDFLNANQKANIVIISGVHGNENSGCITLSELIKNGYFDQMSKLLKINIRVVPCINKLGLKNNTRYIPNLKFPDINRNFHERGAEPISNSILELIKGADLILDFHDGWGYHLINMNSVGSTLSPTNELKTKALSILAVNELNQKIINLQKKFVSINRISCDIPGTLSCYCEKNKIPYILTETTGQNNIQPIEIRSDQIFTIINTILNSF